MTWGQPPAPKVTQQTSDPSRKPGLADLLDLEPRRKTPDPGVQTDTFYLMAALFVVLIVAGWLARWLGVWG